MIDPDQPVVAIYRPDATAVRLDDVGDWVEFELRRLEGLPIPGPYRFAGWSFGGVVALELARTLIDRGDGDLVASVEVIDSWIPERVYRGRIGKMITRLQRTTEHLERMEPLSTDERRAYVREHGPPIVSYRARYAGRLARRAITRPTENPAPPPPPEYLTPERRAARIPWLKYEPRPFPRPVVIYACSRSVELRDGDASLGFGPWLPWGFAVHVVPGSHFSMWDHPNVEVLAAALTDSFTGPSSPDR